MSPGNEIFVIPVVSRTDWHLDARRFLTIIKMLDGINVWLIADKGVSIVIFKHKQINMNNVMFRFGDASIVIH
jgi:hypothetical protein